MPASKLHSSLNPDVILTDTANVLDVEVYCVYTRTAQRRQFSETVVYSVLGCRGSN